MTKLKNTTSLLMVLIMLAPSVAKLGHHHEHFICKSAHEKQLHSYHEKCLVCSFEFSTFSLCKTIHASVNTAYKKPNNSNFYQEFIFSCSIYLFLLRSPPLFSSTPSFHA